MNGLLFSLMICTAAGASDGDAYHRPLELFLNNIRLGAESPKRSEENYATIEPGGSVGQTFKTGPGETTVARIAIWECFWHETWDPDEVLLMTLWDSPEKKVAYGRYPIPYSQRMWESAVPFFLLEARVEPNRSYYFELTTRLTPMRPASIPKEWLLEKQRPGIAGGDRKVGGIGIARADYPDGTAYLDGQPQDYDLWFQVHVRPELDRDAVYQKAFDRFDLDYPPLAAVKTAVQAKDWDKAVTELVRHFENREDLIDAERRRPKFDPSFDPDWADWTWLQQVRLEDGYYEDLRPNWNHYALWPERGGVGLTRTGLRKPLSIAYEHTGNPKYAQAFNDLIMNFLIYCPSPADAGVYKLGERIPSNLPAGLSGGSMWSALSIGARMLHGFHYYTSFIESPFFTEDTRAAWIINLGQLAEVLEYMRGGGNWATQMSDALMKFGHTYPEFKRAKIWYKLGAENLIENALHTVKPDGVLQEPTTNYHILVLNRYSQAVMNAQKMGVDLPQKMVDLTEKMFDFLLYSTMPDGLLPAWGDSNPPTDAKDFMLRGAKIYDRPDFTYIATGGKEGSPPKETSYAFPDGGFYYMRSGWGPWDNYMGIRCGPFGSHGHFDALSVIVAAMGRTVLIDPGVHTYGTPQCRELSSTLSHNTVAMATRNARSSVKDAWMTTDGFDFFAGHNTGYHDACELQQYRRIFYIKNDPWESGLWVLLDDIAKMNDNLQPSYEMMLHFRFAPIDIADDAGKMRVWTESGDNGDGNLLIDVLDKQGLQLVRDQKIAVWGELQKVPDVCFVRNGALPVTFSSLLVPYRGDQQPNYEAKVLTTDDSATRAVWIEAADSAVLVAGAGLESLTEGTGQLSVTLPDGREVSMNGSAAAVLLNQQDGQWKPAHVYGWRLQTLTFGDQKLVDEKEVIQKVDWPI